MCCIVATAATILVFLVSPLYPRPLQEWNSPEVIWDTYRNKTLPEYPVTPPVWLFQNRPQRLPSGKGTHRHEYYDGDGFKHMITYGNMWKWPLHPVYITKHEPLNWDLPLTRWTGGQMRSPNETSEEERYYFINYTANHKSSYITFDGQNDVYDQFWKFYRGLWFLNDTTFYKNINDSGTKIHGSYRLSRFVRRGSFIGKYDDHWPVPIKQFWEGLVLNDGHRNHEPENSKFNNPPAWAETFRNNPFDNYTGLTEETFGYWDEDKGKK